MQQRRNRYPLFFAKLFFLPKKKREEHTGGAERALIGDAVKDGAFKGIGAGIRAEIGVISAENEKEPRVVGVRRGTKGAAADEGSHIGVGDVVKPGIVADP